MHETIQSSVAAMLLKNGGVLMVQVNVQLLEQTKNLLGQTSLFFSNYLEKLKYTGRALFSILILISVLVSSIIN